MTEPTHEPAPLYLNADNCEHSEPDPSDEDNPRWVDWDADHEYGSEGERLCLLTRIGSYCPACTKTAREDYELAGDQYIDIHDCVHAPVLP